MPSRAGSPVRRKRNEVRRGEEPHKEGTGGKGMGGLGSNCHDVRAVDVY